LQDAGLLGAERCGLAQVEPDAEFRGKRLTNAHETMIWASKSEGAKYTFNYEALKALNEGVQMRSDWVLPICTGHERLKDAKGDKAHPTQKPESCCTGCWWHDQPRRCGAGPVLWHRHHRRRGQDAGPPFHRDRARGGLSQRRRRPDGPGAPLDASALETTGSKRAEPRVPFGQLVERGLLRPGEMLVSPRGKAAKVRADGTLAGESLTGSIHQVGAH
jgi:modification methylase